jgi:hypothetical protein
LSDHQHKNVVIYMPCISRSPTSSPEASNGTVFIRGAKLFTANEALMLDIAGHLTHSKRSEVIFPIIKMQSTCLEDDT